MRGCTGCGRIYAESHPLPVCAGCGVTLTAMPLEDVMRLARERQRRLREERQAARSARPSPVMSPAPVVVPHDGAVTVERRAVPAAA
jgi:hypothetical protein